MPKIYNETNVLTATFNRLNIILNDFDNVYFSISGGKDSSVMLQLACKVARKLGKKINVLYIDLEAQYKATIEHVELLMEESSDVVDNFYWICLPLSLRNAVSVLQPKWKCWDPEEKDKWVRLLPDNSNVISLENCPFSWFYEGMEFEEFIILFAEWFTQQNTGSCAAGIGIRSNESLNRFRTIVNTQKSIYKNYSWTTQVKKHDKFLNIYNFYPLYDWRTQDIWGVVSLYDLPFNPVYEWLYKNGVGIHQQRLCQPYGDDQRGSLDQFRTLEPETWERVLNRVEGVNFGNIYARTSLLGNIKSEKPEHMTWEEYTVFLLESLGLYAPELRDHYYRKISKFLKWYEKNEGLKVTDIPDVADKKLESQKKVASWRRIGRAIERNDFWLSRLSFGETKSDVKLLEDMKVKYRTNLIKTENTDSISLKRVARKLYGES
jgi:predicted phosphoadenosine phosphosulfate sulfurtransferase